MTIGIQEMRERYVKTAAASIYDALDTMGYPAQCMCLEIKPVTATTHLAGPAFTVRGSREPRYDEGLKRPQFEDFGLFKAMHDGCIVVLNAEADRVSAGTGAR